MISFDIPASGFIAKRYLLLKGDQLTDEPGCRT
jgi:hypothetical protein